MKSSKLDLLHVEDSPADQRMMRLALERLDAPCRLHVARDGEAALAFLSQAPPFEDAPRPDLILLDLNLPRLDGRELLERIKANPSWKRIPILVLSSSAASADVTRAYDLHANCYLTKPPDYVQLEELVRRVEEFWMRTIQLPRPV